MIKVTFNKAIENLDKADVSVQNEKTLVKLPVKAVKLAEDKMSAEVSLHDPMVSETSYKVTVKDAGEASLKFVIVDIDKFVVDQVQYVPNALTPIRFKVVDKNGLDITALVKDNLTFKSSIAGVVDAEGKITLSTGDVAIIDIFYKEGTEEEVKSPRITVKCEDAKAAKLLNVSLSTVPLTVTDFEKSDFDPVTMVHMGSVPTLYAFAEDQFGNKFVTSKTFESLDRSVAIVNTSNGQVTPLRVGAFDVRFKNGSVNEVKSLSVVGQSTLAKLELEKAEVTITDKETAEVKVKLKDQFGLAYTGTSTDGNMTAKVKTGADFVEVTPVSAPVNGHKEESFNIKGKAAGTATVEFAVGKNKVVLTVKVEEVGLPNGFVMTGFVEKLDKSGTVTSNPPRVMDLKVFPAHDGKIAGAAVTSNVNYRVLDSDGGEAIGSTSITTQLDAAPLKKGVYTLEVTVNDIPVDNKVYKFTVVDSNEKIVTLKKDKLVVNKNIGENLETELTNLLEATVGGKPVAVSAFTLVKFDSDVNTVIASQVGGVHPNTVVTLTEGETVLRNIKVTVVLGTLPSAEYEVAAEGLTVVVADKTSPTFNLTTDTKAAPVITVSETLADNDGIDIKGKFTLNTTASGTKPTIASATHAKAAKTITFAINDDSELVAGDTITVNAGQIMDEFGNYMNTSVKLKYDGAKWVKE